MTLSPTQTLQRGDLSEVTVDTYSTALTVATGIGDTTLHVANATDFDDAGTLQLGTHTYDFTTDLGLGGDDPTVLHLDTAMLEVVDVDRPVTMLTAAGTPAERWTAWLHVGDDAEPIPAVIPSEDTTSGLWVPGTSQAGAIVDFTSTELGYAVVSRPNQPSTIDAGTVVGEFTDQVTVPAAIVATDGNAPAATPDPQVYSAIGGLAVRLPAVDNADQVIVDVWISTSNPPSTAGTPNGSVVMPPGGPALFPAREIAGTKLAVGTTYYVRTRARDADGNGPLSAVVSGTPAAATGNDVVVTADMLIANNALITALTVVDLSTVNLTSVNINGAAITIAQSAASTENQDYTGTALPAGWTTGTNGAGKVAITVANTGLPAGTSGSALKVDNSLGTWSGAGEGSYYAWTKTGTDVGDFFIETRFYVTGARPDVSPSYRLRIGARAGNVTGVNPVGLYLDLTSSLWSVQLSGTSIVFDSYSNGPSVATALQTNTWYRAKLSVSGGIVSAKVWAEGTTEPAYKTGQATIALAKGPAFVALYQPFGTSRITGQTYIDWMNITGYSAGFQILPDATGDWPYALDPLRTRLTALENIAASTRLAALEATNIAAIPAASGGTFTSTATVEKVGNLAIMGGGFGRGTSFSTAFTKCGTVPAGYRPAQDITLPAATLFNSTITYQLQVQANGDVNVRQSAATTGNMSGTGAAWRIGG